MKYYEIGKDRELRDNTKIKRTYQDGIIRMKDKDHKDKTKIKKELKGLELTF